MLTTLKYEFMKNRVLYGISLGILAIVELVYLAIVPFRSIKDHTIVIPIFLLMIAGLFIFFMLLFNGITMFSRDLKSKAGYLVYMTPVPVPSILLAKILLVFLSSVIFGLGYLLLGIADFEILGHYYFAFLDLYEGRDFSDEEQYREFCDAVDMDSLLD
ncbi:MAG: hypothetical protein II566_04945, partial [Lachnospiraceae bacterium]|nr:hypothetical protein [Lachnospiraceae bacterium]